MHDASHCSRFDVNYYFTFSMLNGVAVAHEWKMGTILHEIQRSDSDAIDKRCKLG